MVHPIGHGIETEVRHELSMVERFPSEIGKAARRFTSSVSEKPPPDGENHVPPRCLTLALCWSTQSTAEGSHEQPGEDRPLYSQVGIEFFLGTKPFHVSARFAGVEDGGGELVRQPHLEGQASL